MTTRRFGSGTLDYSELCVFKYEDVNGDGKYVVADGDKPYEGWGIVVKNVAGAIVKSGDTGADGWICWDDMKPGTYYVSEETVTGWYAHRERDPTGHGGHHLW